MDGCLLSGWALRLFRSKSLQEIQEIAFEIGEIREGISTTPRGAREKPDP